VVDILPKLGDPLPLLLLIPVPNSKNVSVSTDDAEADKEGKFEGDCERSSFCVVHALGAVEEDDAAEKEGAGGSDGSDSDADVGSTFDGHEDGDVDTDVGAATMFEFVDSGSKCNWPPAADLLPDTDTLSNIDTTSATRLSKLSFLSGDGDDGRDAPRPGDDADE
jgi:hypothetical protein